MMSSLAENYGTVAATWQLKHQVAYWKARALSLQYENTVLHEVIRRNFEGSDTELEQTDGQTEDSEESDSDCHTEENSTESGTENSAESESENSTESESEYDESQNENDGDELEVSEEFIQFLISNAKYREDAKRERELLKAKLEEGSKVPEPQETIEDRISRKKKMYGDKYMKIMALEMYLDSEFQEMIDKTKATYWPNIPFNFNVN